MYHIRPHYKHQLYVNLVALNGDISRRLISAQTPMASGAIVFHVADVDVVEASTWSRLHTETLES